MMCYNFSDMLAIEGYSASEMAMFFDELEHDHARTIIELQVADLSPRSVLYGETDRFLYLLRELRNVFRQCGCWNLGIFVKIIPMTFF